MGRVKQLASLYGIRGAIASQTMSKLTQEQIDRIDSIVQEVFHCSDLIGDKIEFCNQLGNTIGGDYYSDKTTGEQEFRMAIWRATVYLLYHHYYKYSCTICGESDYQIKNSNKRKDFDRQYKCCPNCNKSRLDDGRIVSLKKKINKGYILSDEDGKELGIYNYKKDLDHILNSPIKPILGEKKILNSEEILKDEFQRNRWYSTWIWNYFRQILNENKIAERQDPQVAITGPAHDIALKIILSEAKKYKYGFYFDESTYCRSNEYEITMPIELTSYTFSSFLNAIKHEYLNYNVNIEISEHGIMIKAGNNVELIEDFVKSKETVMMLSVNTSSNNDDDSRNWGDVIENNRIDQPEETHSHDTNDEFDYIRDDLSDDTCKRMFDIFCQRSESWSLFSEKYSQFPPCKTHLSKFFKVSVKKIEDYSQEIKETVGILMELDEEGKPQELSTA